MEPARIGAGGAKPTAARAAAGRAEQIRSARWCVARAQQSLGQFEAVLATQRALLAELELAGEKDGYVFEELAENLLALNQPAAAEVYFALAHTVTGDE